MKVEGLRAQVIEFTTRVCESLRMGFGIWNVEHSTAKSTKAHLAMPRLGQVLTNALLGDCTDATTDAGSLEHSLGSAGQDYKQDRETRATGAQHSTREDDASRTPGGVMSCSPARNIDGDFGWTGGECEGFTYKPLIPLETSCASVKRVCSFAGLAPGTTCMVRGACWNQI